ncbi:hypothetical protein, partial [Tenebrionicola larvae]
MSCQVAVLVVVAATTAAFITTSISTAIVAQTVAVAPFSVSVSVAVADLTLVIAVAVLAVVILALAVARVTPRPVAVILTAVTPGTGRLLVGRPVVIHAVVRLVAPPPAVEVEAVVLPEADVETVGPVL